MDANMGKRISLVGNVLVLLVLIGCSNSQSGSKSVELSGWEKEGQVLKSIANINFNFPDHGFAFESRNDLIDECFDAMQSDIQIIDLDEFTDTIRIRFLKTRNDMSVITGMYATGMAYPHNKTLYVVADSSEKIKPPIKHELMHLIAMLEWGYPHNTSTCINEGLATYAEDNCNGYSVSEIYRYFLDTDQLIHIDSLTTDFYHQPEMVGYHQSAYVVEYLLNNYSINQFKRLWKEGFDSFESIYSVSFQEMQKELDKSILKEHPEVPNIDWETFKEGCMK